jgi:hypothetical protein
MDIILLLWNYIAKEQCFMIKYIAVGIFYNFTFTTT